MTPTRYRARLTRRQASTACMSRRAGPGDEGRAFRAGQIVFCLFLRYNCLWLLSDRASRYMTAQEMETLIEQDQGNSGACPQRPLLLD